MFRIFDPVLLELHDRAINPAIRFLRLSFARYPAIGNSAKGKLNNILQIPSFRISETGRQILGELQRQNEEIPLYDGGDLTLGRRGVIIMRNVLNGVPNFRDVP